VEKAEYDLIVIGGGPAGCACAIASARAGANVLLLEKDRFPRHKVCGEFVSPESLQLLHWLLGQDLFASNPAIRSARVFSGKKIASLPIRPAARSIARYDLDASLLQSARSCGVRAEEEVTVKTVERNGIFLVNTREVKSREAESGERSFTSRAVVNATGRWSHLNHIVPNRRPSGNAAEMPSARLHTQDSPSAMASPKVQDSLAQEFRQDSTQSASQDLSKDGGSPKWIGLKAHFAEEQPNPSVDLYFFDQGYCGVQPVSENAVNVCVMVRADAARSLDQAFSLHTALHERSRRWQPLFSAVATSGLYFRKPRTYQDGMLLAGDVAAFIDPFAGDGISLALHSGVLASQALTPFLEGTIGLEQALKIYEKNYQHRLAPALRNAALVRRVLAAPRFVRSLIMNLIGMRMFADSLVRGTRIGALGSGHTVGWGDGQWASE